MKFRWIRKPIPRPINIWTLCEHFPLDPYKGEYPRWIRPPHNEPIEWEWVKLYEDGSIARPGETPSRESK